MSTASKTQALGWRGASMALRLSRPSRWLFIAWLHKVAHDPDIIRSSQITRTVQLDHDTCPDTGVADDYRCHLVANAPLVFSYEGTVAAENPPVTRCVSIGLPGFAHALGCFSVWGSGLDPLDCFVHVDGAVWRIGWGIRTCGRLRGNRSRRQGRGRA